MRRTAWLFCGIPLLLSAVAATADQVVLSTDSLWRCRYAEGTDVIRADDGRLVAVHPEQPREKVRKTADGEQKYVEQFRVHPKTRIWAVPPADWMAADFDDAAWPRLAGPFLVGRDYRSVPLACLRGKFQVADPARAEGLTLSLGYHGGVVVYVNGQELLRRNLPEGKLAPAALAEAYPTEAFLDKEGFLVAGTGSASQADRETFRRAAALRLRSISDVKIPPQMLRKGTNVLAIELHRAPAVEAMFMQKAKAMPWNTVQLSRTAWWARVGLASVQLLAPAGAAVVGPAARPEGLQVWTCPIYQELGPGDCGDPADGVGRVRLCTGTNGVCSGVVVASADAPFKGLAVAVSDLTGPGTIPASAVQLRYARMGWFRSRTMPSILCELEDFPQEQAAVQPVWLTVRVPADARPGRYSGTATVRVAGHAPVAVPLELSVVDWRVPEPAKFMSFLELIESPDSLAMQYNVPMWSERHWQLLDRTFALLGEVGNDMLWITAQRHTHFGNAEATIRFRREGGELKPDLGIAERYVATAARHMRGIRVVALYCYRCPWGEGMHYGQHESQDLPVLLSAVGPDGKLEEAEGPAWGTPQCVALWKPVFDGMKAILAKNGIPPERLMIAATGDVPATDEALDTLRQASGGQPWVFESHVARTMLGSRQDHPVGYITRAWGGDGAHQDPDFGRGYGWKNTMRPWRTVTREHFDDHALPSLRLRLEAMVTNVIHPKNTGGPKDLGTHGIGRLGADFWNVLADRRGRKSELCGRYPETAWGQLKVTYCAQHFLAPGRDGAIGTAQLEMFREGAQEIEARVFIEKALADPAKKAKLGNKLAYRAQALLDDRTRVLHSCLEVLDKRGPVTLGIQEQSEALYALAAEVAAALAR